MEVILQDLAKAEGVTKPYASELQHICSDRHRHSHSGPERPVCEGLIVKHSVREQKRKEAEDAAARRKQQRSEGFKPYNGDGVPDQPLTTARAQKR